MVEPRRKRRKSYMEEVFNSPRTGLSGHASLEVRSDWIEDEFREFECGRPEAKDDFVRWGGPFKGRPELYRELIPAIRRRVMATDHRKRRRLKYCDRLKTSFRSWWRLLDKYDEEFRVRSVLDLDDTHGALQIRHGIPASYTSDFLAIVNETRVQMGAVELFWSKTESNSAVLDVSPPKYVRPIYQALKQKVRTMWWRWQAADAAVEQGVNWDGQESARGPNQVWTDQDIHATYRGLSKRLDHPCPSLELCRESITVKHGVFSKSLSVAVFGLFPSREDIQACFALFLLRTGWNASVALDLDVEQESNWFRPHPTSERHHLVFSVKERGNTEQVAIGLTKSDLSPGTLIHALLERTAPLRETLQAELSELLKHSLTPETQNRVDELRESVRSPWIYVHSRSHFEIRSLDRKAYADATNLGELIGQLNVGRPADDQIPAMTISDFRDSFISYAYQRSGYSWLIAQLAAGHKSIESLKTYLRKRRFHAHGAGQLVKLGNAMWAEISVHRCVDAAILFAMVQRGEVTPEQRQRWLAYKDRTRVGMVCRDFKHPPKHIAPHHVEGAGCRVHRCILCEHGIVLEDSVDHLCRRVAELRHLQCELPLVTWLQSSFCDELERTETVLEANFDREHVALLVQAWTDEIASGRHRVLSMEGEYGSADEAR